MKYDIDNLTQMMRNELIKKRIKMDVGKKERLRSIRRNKMTNEIFNSDASKQFANADSGMTMVIDHANLSI
jgi:hypothetical protein